MSDRDIIRRWTDEAEDQQTYGEDTLPPQAIRDATLQQLDGYIAAAATQLAALRQVNTWLKTEMATRLGHGHSVRIGNWFYRAGTTTSYKVPAETRREFWDLVNDHDFAERLFNPNSARKSALRELGEKYIVADPETGEVVGDGLAQFVYDILDVVEKPDLTRVEVGSADAPDYAQDMKDGEIR